MLKGTLLSYNSSCQVSARRLWDCAICSPGLLNWLCYCRPVQGEGSKWKSGLWWIRYPTFDGDPPPRGRVFTAALSREGDLALDPCPWVPQDQPPPRVFLSEVIMEFLLPFPFLSTSICLAQQADTNSLRSANFYFFWRRMPTLFQCLALVPPTLPRLHTCI